MALGRALVREPQAFLMDEPLSNLDAKLRTQTRGEIKRVQQEVGTTTVYVTHDQVEAMTMGDRIAVMNDGVLEQVGTPEELYERPANRFVGGFIGSPAMTFFEAAARAEDGGVRLRGESVDVVLPVGGGGAATSRSASGRRRRGSGTAQPASSGRCAARRVRRGARPRDVRRRRGRRRAWRCSSRAAPRSAVGDTVEFGLVPSALRYFAPDGAAL